MTNSDILKSAVTISGELNTGASGDYTIRAFPVLASIYNQCAPLDQAYRKAYNLPESTWVPDTDIRGLENPFPLADVFLAVVPYALAALLVIDENTELSNLLYARYVAGLDDIRRMIPAVPEPIADRYHLF